MTHPQAGILNRPPDHALFVALSLVSGDSPTARTAVEGLRSLIHAELCSDLDQTTPASDKTQPSAETGELGTSLIAERTDSVRRLSGDPHGAKLGTNWAANATASSVDNESC
jgi:hypothetical protein